MSVTMRMRICMGMSCRTAASVLAVAGSVLACGANRVAPAGAGGAPGEAIVIPPSPPPRAAPAAPALVLAPALAPAAPAASSASSAATDAAPAADLGAPDASSPSPSPDGDAIREAVLRHMFGKNASGQQQRARVFCIELEGGADPSPAFLARFKGVRVPLRPGSGCTKSPDKGVIDKKTHARGLAFRVDSLRQLDRDHAVVEGGYYEAGLSASGNTYTLERQNGAWVVTKDVMNWIS
jgi:hypothetical protein